MINIKKFTSLFMELILICSVTACEDNTSKLSTVSDSINKSTNDKQISIEISWWGGESRHEATQAAIERYETLNPDVDVRTHFGAWDGWEKIMSTSLYAGTASDICQINWNWISDYSSDGSRFLDIKTVSDYFNLEYYDKSALEQCTLAGELQAIPVSMTGRIFYWDKTTFDEAGISVPKTLEELYEAGEIFRTKLGDEYYPLALAEYDRTILMVYYLESVYGKQWVKDGKLNYSVDQIAEGLEFIQSLEDKHVIPSIKTIIGDGAVSLDKNIKWMNGTYAGIFEWDSAATKFGTALDKGRRFIVGDYFSDMGKYNGGFTKVSLCFAISESTKYPDECAKLLNFLLNEDEGTALMSFERGIPLSTAALKNCKKLGLLAEDAAIANGKVIKWAKFPLDTTFENAQLKNNPDGLYFDVMSGLSYGDYSVKKAAEILSKGISEVLAE